MTNNRDLITAKIEAWKIVTAAEGQEWPCAIVDSDGRSLLGVHNGTPVIRDRALAERVLVALTAPAKVSEGERK